MMHAANVLVEAQHMVEQGYPMKKTEHVLEVTLREMREEFDQLTDIMTNMLKARDMYRNNKVLTDFFLLWDGGKHMHAFDEHKKASLPDPPS